MRRTMNIWVLVAIFACVLAGVLWYGNSFRLTLEELDETYNDAQLRLSEMQGKQAELKTMLETVGTDAFIENQARTIYGYMMPDEIRFVITNPEALYGDQEIPSR